MSFVFFDTENRADVSAGEQAKEDIREAYAWARDLLIYLDDEVDQSAAATLAVAMLERRDRIMASVEVWKCTSTT